MSHLSKINPEKLHALTNRPGALHHISQKVPGGSLMQGDFLLTQQVSGIWVHASRVQELQDATSTFELPPGLSFTFVFEGEAKFSLANKEYTFKASEEPDAIECSAICFSQNEIVSRKIYKGESVYKLNISIDKENLESRCRLANDNIDLHHLFQVHGAIHQWKISDELKKLVFKLMDIVNQESMLQRLHIESYATEILFHVLSSLKKECAKTGKNRRRGLSELVPRLKENSQQGKKLQEKIDLLLHKSVELDEIAQQLNMSVSTLQRRFKSVCGCTVIDYIRRKRLQIARNKMVAGEMNLTEAANFSGYKHNANFVTAFKKTFGTTPHAYCKDVGY